MPQPRTPEQLFTPRAAGVLRIASVPAGHSYVRNVTAAAKRDGQIEVLADPQPEGAPAGQWWPPVVLGPSWIEANAAEFDVLHIHFGFESFSTAELAERVEALRRMHRPIVVTVHDLENPQLSEQSSYAEQLGVLVGAADELVTLTPGAAAEIARRWAREPTVIPHPWVVGSAPRAGSAAASEAPTAEALRVGVHLRDLRPNIDALTIVSFLLDAVDELVAEGLPVVAVVDCNERVRDAETRSRLRRMVEASPHGEWNEHPRLDDADLAESVAALDISVLPYRHGTHSGWLELCWDLGVAVLAPAIGYYAEQHDEPGALVSFLPGSYPSFSAALSALVAPLADSGSLGESRGVVRPEVRRSARGNLSRSRMDARQIQAREISAAQVAVYRRALARVAA